MRTTSSLIPLRVRRQPLCAARMNYVRLDPLGRGTYAAIMAQSFVDVAHKKPFGLSRIGSQ